MEPLLVKIFATALALSQVTTTPDAVKTQFDRTRDQEQVARLLRAGCTPYAKVFDIEDINLDDLIATAIDDPQAIAREQGVSRHQFRRSAEPPIGSFARTRRSRGRPSISAM